MLKRLKYVDLMSKTIKQYLAEIGAKGGKIGGKKLAGTPQAKIRAKKAAKARWAKAKAKTKKTK